MSESQIDSTSGAKEMICSTCHIKFISVHDYKMHIKSDFHTYNVKRRMADLAPVSEEVFESKRADMVSANASAISEVQYKCYACNKVFKSIEQLNEHKKSKKHKQNEKKYLAQNPNSSKSSIFQSFNLGSESQISNQDRSHTGNILDVLQENLKDTEEVRIEKEGIETEKRLDKAEEGKKKEKRTALDSPRICLFSNKEFDGVKQCLDHMRLKYGFILLDVDCLVDLKGLLEYMAQRIHLGHLCLFCSQQFKDAERCQQHMIDKRHCAMNMTDEEEYADFYDFSRIYKDHPLLLKEKPKPVAGEEGYAEEEDKDDKSWDDVDVASMDSDEADDEAKDLIDEMKKPKDKEPKEEVEENTYQDLLDEQNQVEGAEKVPKPKVTGVGRSREEVFESLSIKKAELLPSGEVLLANGKTMGNKKWHYIYKQKPKPKDERECVVINKIALEYRKIRALQNGGIGDQLELTVAKDAKQARKQEQKAHNARSLYFGMQFNMLQHHFRDPTGHLQ